MMFKKTLAVFFTLIAFVACSEKQEGVVPIELTFDVKHQESSSVYIVHALVQLSGVNNSALPDNVQQRAKQAISNSLTNSLGMFFGTYPDGVKSKDAEYLGFNACESAIRQVSVVKSCKVTAMSWKKK